MAISPPYCWRLLFTIITMTHAVTFIRNGDIPMDNILLMIRFFIFQNPRCRRTTLVFCRKWLTTHTMPMNCEMTVAVAAPRIPQSNWKMKMGARIMLQTTVTIDVSIAFLGYPVARMILFRPIMV